MVIQTSPRHGFRRPQATAVRRDDLFLSFAGSMFSARLVEILGNEPPSARARW